MDAAEDRFAVGRFAQQEASRPLRKPPIAHTLIDPTSGSVVGGVNVGVTLGTPAATSEFAAWSFRSRTLIESIRWQGSEKRLDIYYLHDLGRAHQAPLFDQESPRASVIELYERRLNELREEMRRIESERNASAAASNRALLGAMIDDDWLGSRLLAHLSEPMTAGDLAGAMGVSVDQVAATLARLHRGGAIDAQGDRFHLNEHGSEILARLQKATGVVLAPS